VATRGRIRTGAGAPLRQLTTALKECDRAEKLITAAEKLNAATRERIAGCIEVMRKTKMKRGETGGTRGTGRTQEQRAA
jgi:hypothetical protein